MRPTIHWIALPALVAGVPGAAFATTYLSVEQAQQAIFPRAELEKIDLQLTPEQCKAIEKRTGVKVRVPRVDAWRVKAGGWLFIDEVIGKHETITYALGLDSDGSVKQVEVMAYRENYGGEIRRGEWLGQFARKDASAHLALDDDIKNISGATLSCRHVTEGVKRLLATYELVLAK